MSTLPARILIVDDNCVFRMDLAERMRRAGYDVVTASTGASALLLLRDRTRPVAWLFTRAALPGLVDGWILADEYHVACPQRPAVIAANQPRAKEVDVVLDQPTAAAVCATMQDLVDHAAETPADPVLPPKLGRAA